MKSSNHFPGKLLNLIQRRFIRSRPGSVLILVVALLVLMALVGTAYMTMAQFDRVSSAQHGFNTEVDLLLDGVSNQVEGTVTADLFPNSQYRSAIPTPSTTTTINTDSYNEPGEYQYYNGQGMDLGTIASLYTSPLLINTAMNTGDWWLASRLPDYEATAGGQYMPSQWPVAYKAAGTSATTPAWAYITGPINGNQYFDTPYWPSGTQVQYTSHGGINPTLEAANVYAVSNLMVPSSITITAQAGSSALPAFNVAPRGSTSPTPILAADADGDGIADSGLVKILSLDGVTYYAAVRIIDNCAAINASIATRPNPFSGPSSTTPSAGTPLTYIPGEFSPANLDLEGILISPTAELYGSTGLLNWRFNKLTPSLAAVDANGGARSDFYWMTYPYGGQNLFFDQQWAQLGSRMDNPGNIVAGVSTNPNNLFQALPITESMALAHKFCICNPSVFASPSSSPSVLEQRLPNSLVSLSPTSPYAASDTADWIKNFVYTSTGTNTTTPDRAVLVARNPVSNFCPAKFSTPTGSAYRFGDIVADANHCQYVCIDPGTTAAPISPVSDPHFSDPNWAYEPWTTSPTKTSVNTATFQQLYAAFWAVMADQYVSVGGQGQWEPAFYGTTPSNTTGRMFRSPIRTGSNSPKAPLTAQQTMYLRAALAAVNTMDLRDSDDDVTSRTITIPADPLIPSSVAYQANVYGAEKQPYITEVYARNDMSAANDFVAIDLYNPFQTAISLTNWEFAIMDRTMSPMTPQLLTKITTPTSIGPRQHLIFVSVASPTNVTLPTTSAAAAIVPITQLNQAFGKELVLVKPRLANGTLVGPIAAQNNVYDETANVDDLIPVDCYDFTNLPATADPTKTQEWFYARPGTSTVAGTTPNWRFVYPGPWNINAKTTTASTPTMAGTIYATPAATTTTLSTYLGVLQSAPSPMAALPGGTGITVAQSMPYIDAPLQVNNTDFGGPNKDLAATANVFPYGGFPRNGDILQVTYVGAYKLYPAGQPRNIVEWNSLSMDSMMATARDGEDAASPYEPLATASTPGAPGVSAENIGRFCPIDVTNAKNAGVTGVDDFNDSVLNPTTSTTMSSILAQHRYHWAMRLFDYLTAMSPQDDYTPNVDPWLVDLGYGVSTFPYGNTTQRYPGVVPLPVANVISSLANAGLPAGNVESPNQFSTGQTEETAPVQGLINVNTAPWRVLATIPWQPQGYDPSVGTDGYRGFNTSVAQAIAYYRDVDDGATGENTSTLPIHGHGPFKNLFELNEAFVQGSRLNYYMDGSSDPTAAQGNLRRLYSSATPPATDQVTGDFESQFNVLTRVSNLITTRSDSYTAYILVQGWRNAETNNPTLVAQRRATIIIDRSAVTPVVTSPTVYNVPN